MTPVLLPFPILRQLEKNFIYYSFLSFLFKKKINKVKKFVNTCIEKNAIYFMDNSNLLNTNKYLFSQFNTESFLPVGIPSQSKKNSNNLDKKLINITWVGRLCDFKIHILLYTIKNLIRLSSKMNLKMIFNVVGDGPYSSKLNKIKITHSKFSLNKYGNIENKKLTKILLNNTDLFFGMGTSILESSSLSIPTVSLDYSYKPIKNDYKYKFIFMNKDYDLGHEISDKDCQRNNDSLQNILNMVLKDSKKIGYLSYEYFNNNHRISEVTLKFLSAVKKSNLMYKDLDKKLFSKSILRKLYEFLRWKIIKK